MSSVYLECILLVYRISRNSKNAKAECLTGKLSHFEKYQYYLTGPRLQPFFIIFSFYIINKFMEAIKLTIDWNAEPNAPEVVLSIVRNTIILDFYVNYFLFENFMEGDKVKVIFKNCHKYSYNSMNDEGYYKGQYRYKYTELPWGILPNKFKLAN
jgi:hypothetical protein